MRSISMQTLLSFDAALKVEGNGADLFEFYVRVVAEL